MINIYSNNPLYDAIKFCSELRTCMGTCKISDKRGNRAIVLGAPFGISMKLLMKEVNKSRDAMMRRSVFEKIPPNVAEHAFVTIVFEKAEVTHVRKD